MTTIKSTKSSAGKGMSPRKGYDPKNWYRNFDKISWKKPIDKSKS